MRNRFLGILLLSTFGLAAGCDSKETHAVTNPRARDLPVTEHKQAESAEQAEQAVEHTLKAAQALQGYVWARKTEFVVNMKKELADIQAGIDLQAAKAERATGEIKEEVKLAITGMRLRWAQAQERLKAAESAEEDRWDEVKGGFAKAYDELKEAVNKTRQWWTEKDEN